MPGHDATEPFPYDSSTGYYTALALLVMMLSVMTYDMRFALPTTVGIMALAAGIYIRLTHPTKKAMSQRRQEVGLNEGARVELDFQRDQVVLAVGETVHRWPYQNVSVSAKLRGVLIRLEPQLFLLVPKTSHFSSHSYRNFVRLLTQRVESTGS